MSTPDSHQQYRRRLLAATIGLLTLSPRVVDCFGAGVEKQKTSHLLVTQFCKTQPACPFSVLAFNGKSGEFAKPFLKSLPGKGPDAPDAIAVGPDGHLYVSSTYTHEILRYHGQTGEQLETFVRARSGGLNTPHVFRWGPDRNLYVTSRGTRNILRYDGKNGRYMNVFIPAGKGRLNDPTDLLFRSDGKVYVSDYTTDGRPPALENPNPPGRGGAIRRYDAKTGAFIDNFIKPGPKGKPSSEGLDGPHCFIIGPDGNFYVVSSLSNRILRYEGRSGKFIDTFVPPGRGNMKSPEGIAFGPDGNLYVSDFELHCVLRFRGNDGAFIDCFIPPGHGGLLGPGMLIFHETS